MVVFVWGPLTDVISVHIYHSKQLKKTITDPLLFLPVASSRFVPSNRCPCMIGLPKSQVKSSLSPKQPGFAQSSTDQKSNNLFCKGVPVKPILKTRFEAKFEIKFRRIVLHTLLPCICREDFSWVF